MSAPRRILVVDDESGFRSMLDWNLRGEGVQVDTASNGEEAEAKAAAVSYALVLTDVSMAGVDGLGLLQRLRKRDPSLPVILMTGFGTVEMAVEAMKQGAADFVLKPFDVAAMMARVRGLLGLPSASAGRDASRAQEV